MVKPTAKQKQAMSLLTLLASMIVVIVSIMVATPIITKRLQNISTGQASNDTINLSVGRGHFMCYKDEQGKLFQVRVDIEANGREIVSGPEAVGEKCVFDVPQRADSFSLTLIGGGGGGAGSNAEVADIPIASDSVNFGITKTEISNIFANYYEYFSTDKNTGQKEIRDNIGNILNDFKVGIVISGASGKSENGVPGQPGAKCKMYLMDNQYKLDNDHQSITYRSGAAKAQPDFICGSLGEDCKGENGEFRYTDKGKDIIITAHGGRAPVLYGGKYIKYFDCKRNSHDYSDCRLFDAGNRGDNNEDQNSGTCFESDPINTISDTEPDPNKPIKIEDVPENVESVIKAGETPYAVLGDSNTKIHSLPLSINKYGIKIYVASNGGSAGEVSTQKVSYLGTGPTIDIPKESIGTGGTSGSSTCNNETPNDCSGGDGTATTLTLATATGNVTYRANGGKGALTYSNIITAAGSTIPNTTEDGGDGLRTAYSIHPSLLATNNDENANAGNQTNLTPGAGAKGADCLTTAMTWANNRDIAGCNGLNSLSYPGNGGGSAALAYQLASSGKARITSTIGNTTYFYPDPTNNKHPNDAKTFFYHKGIGGRGGNGAIIISW